MLGRLPWFALLRRSLAFFFFVFLDIGATAYAVTSDRHQGRRPGVAFL
ncbi:MAG TPA: hypothetical protein VF855_12780 [Acidimicrobiales bacterium]